MWCFIIHGIAFWWFLDMISLPGRSAKTIPVETTSSIAVALLAQVEFPAIAFLAIVVQFVLDIWLAAAIA
jgi:hypothetical protein